MCRSAAICALLVTLCDVMGAQTAPLPARWSVTIYLGSTAGSTTDNLEAAMRSAGYTQNFGGCDIFGCVPTRPSPESYSHANPALFAIRYAMTNRYGIEVLLGGSAQGTTSGRSSSEIIDVEFGGTVFAPILSIGSPTVRVGVGPALLRAHWDYRNTSGGDVDRVRTTSIGWVGSAAARLKIRSRLYAEGTAEYRGFSSPMVRSSQAGRPAGSASVSHSYLGIGLGVALP